MSKFYIEYEDIKKILAVFYNSAYKEVVHYVDIIHNAKEVDGYVTLKQRLDIESSASVQQVVAAPIAAPVVEAKPEPVVVQSEVAPE